MISDLLHRCTLTLARVLTRLKRRCALSPEQADQLARIKFPCC
ncbi:hypothetical protein TRM7615_04409 [Falsiruegeria mediterranea M17]|uniref:Uncharacterized protein n=1 Tax=Falsiruegeria mediterranea M17 TaxID=1200281 RepID=A0A2R8CEL3_9RHOB|nr:hypothetical protein TRM7615_04409 [Falsiruegeria mediterranea M17]